MHEQIDSHPILATPEQKLVEERALALLARPEIEELRQRLTAQFKADRNAKLIDQEELIRASVEAHCAHACLTAANETPLDPRIVWSIAPDREWMGHTMPDHRFGQDNTDNVYRLAALDENARYRITGRFTPGREPIEMGICAMLAQIGENYTAAVSAFIQPEMMDIAEDGSFAIELDNTLTDGRRNHLCIAGAHTMMVRDTLANWAVELPCSLHIERVDAAPVDTFDMDTMAARALELGTLIAEWFFEKIQHDMFECNPVNLLPSPVPSAGRGGLVTQCATGGYYRLGDNEALVITADTLGARYIGMQLVDMWMISFEYRDRTSSLNHEQAVKDADGRYRWVISARDPGVPNWLDSGGHSMGTILLRWQMLGPDARLEDSVTSEIVPFDSLRDHLPAETPAVDAAMREKQRQDRYAGYLNRLNG